MGLPMANVITLPGRAKAMRRQKVARSRATLWAKAGVEAVRLTGFEAVSSSMVATRFLQHFRALIHKRLGLPEPLPEREGE